LRILKAIDYLDSGIKTLWYTYRKTAQDADKWTAFLDWSRDNIQQGHNAIATLYEQRDIAKQLPNQSPRQFNTYLSSIERDLPRRDEAELAMSFYSKLSKEVKQQFKKSDVSILRTRARCVDMA
jgi:hypothetical protein